MVPTDRSQYAQCVDTLGKHLDQLNIARLRGLDRLRKLFIKWGDPAAWISARLERVWK